MMATDLIDATLPDAVIDALLIGAEELQRARLVENQTEQARAKADDAAWAESWRPFVAAVEAAVPPPLREWIDWAEHEHRQKSRHGEVGEAFFALFAADLYLRCPGCEPVLLQATNGEPGWTIRFHTAKWCAFEKRILSPVRSFPTLYHALAVARETWLAKTEYDANHPL